MLKARVRQGLQLLSARSPRQMSSHSSPKTISAQMLLCIMSFRGTQSQVRDCRGVTRLLGAMRYAHTRQ